MADYARVNSIANTDIQYIDVLPKGTRVVAMRLVTNTELNGKMGVVIRDAKVPCEKYAVRFDGERSVWIRRENIKCVEPDMQWFTFAEDVYPDGSVRYTPAGFYVYDEWFAHTMREQARWSGALSGVAHAYS